VQVFPNGAKRRKSSLAERREFLMVPSATTVANPREQPEEILISLAKAGNENAYKELMRRSWEICMRVATCSLGNREDALDEVQDAFWKAYLHLNTFNQQSKFSTWVARIVINHCLMRLREKKRLRMVPYEVVGPSGEEFTLHEAIDTENPEDLLGGAELLKAVSYELKRIPVLLRVPLELRYIHGLQLAEVAQRLNITVAAAKSRLHRAHLHLKDRMLRHCGTRGFGTLTRVA
jgi:RNA polymerase sigma-70 factor (ECF subfamily)